MWRSLCKCLQSVFWSSVAPVPWGWVVGAAGCPLKLTHSRAVLCGHWWLLVGVLLGNAGVCVWRKGLVQLQFWLNFSSKCSAASSSCECCFAFLPFLWIFLFPSQTRREASAPAATMLHILKLQCHFLCMHHLSHKTDDLSLFRLKDFFTLYKECSGGQRTDYALPLVQNRGTGLK